MATAYSSLLGLALPVQGELPGQWGDEVNNYITNYLDASVAGGLSITADVTLTKTTGSALGATSSQYAILTCSPASVNIVVTAPAAYKIYVVNNTSASYTVTIRGAGPTTGVVLSALEKAVVAWNGTDFFKVATSATDGVSTFSAGSTGLTPSSATSGVVTLAGTLAVLNGGTGVTTSTGTTNVVLSNSPTLVAPDLGSPSSVGTMPAFTLGGTVAGGGNQINNVIIGTTTPLAGAFTTVSASGLLSANANLKVVDSANDFGTIQLGTAATYKVTGGATFSGFRFEVPAGGNQYDFQQGGVTRALINATGLDVTGTLSATGRSGVTMSGQTSAVSLGQVSTDTTYGLLSFNGAFAATTLTGIWGGAGSPDMIIGVPTGGSIYSRVNNSTVTLLNSAGLAVTGTLSATGTLSGGTSGTAYSFSGSAPATSLTLNSSGYLGIGTSSPTVAQLVIKGDGAVSQIRAQASTNTSQGLAFIYNYSSQFGQINCDEAGVNQLDLWYTALNHKFGRNTSSANMTLNSSGQLLIGLTSATGYSNKLVILGATASAYNPSVGQYNSANALRILSGGSPTTGDTAGISIAVGGNAEGYIGIVQNASNYGDFVFQSYSGSYAERARITSSGDLLVGQTSQGTIGSNSSFGAYSSGYIGVASTGDSVFSRRSTDGDVITFRRDTTSVGSIAVTTLLTTYNTTSDYRLKTVIGPVADAGQRIDALQPVEYTWNSNGSRTRGFLAHQFQEVYAGSVSGTKDAVDADGKPVYQAMQASTSEVIADLVAELQSLRARVAQLESKP